MQIAHDSIVSFLSARSRLSVTLDGYFVVEGCGKALERPRDSTHPPSIELRKGRCYEHSRILSLLGRLSACGLSMLRRVPAPATARVTGVIVRCRTYKTSVSVVGLSGLLHTLPPDPLGVGLLCNLMIHGGHMHDVSDSRFPHLLYLR